MRCPSEVLTLKWSDVLWDQEKLRIDSPKTGVRFCPIFPELAPILEAAFDAAPEGATFCVQQYRHGYNPATTMKKIIERAGHEPWPKLFINCRSTRRTELQRQYPDHVINKWLGHSSAVAEKHYLQVTTDDWAEGATRTTVSEVGQSVTKAGDHERPANDFGGGAGGDTQAISGGHSGPRAQKKPAKARLRASTSFGIAAKATPQGLEEPAYKTGNSSIPSPGGNAGGNTRDTMTAFDSLAELTSLWRHLHENDRAELVWIAESMAMGTPGMHTSTEHRPTNPPA
jgi:hypothetical protein